MLASFVQQHRASLCMRMCMMSSWPRRLNGLKPGGGLLASHAHICLGAVKERFQFITFRIHVIGAEHVPLAGSAVLYTLIAIGLSLRQTLGYQASQARAMMITTSLSF